MKNILKLSAIALTLLGAGSVFAAKSVSPLVMGLPFDCGCCRWFGRNTSRTNTTTWRI